MNTGMPLLMKTGKNNMNPARTVEDFFVKCGRKSSCDDDRLSGTPREDEMSDD